MEIQREQRGNQLDYLFAALGMVIGTGNVWRFPRVWAANGGGAFLIAWTVAMLLYAAPLLMSEMVLGKRRGLAPWGLSGFLWAEVHLDGHLDLRRLRLAERCEAVSAAGFSTS